MGVVSSSDKLEHSRSNPESAASSGFKVESIVDEIESGWLQIAWAGEASLSVEMVLRVSVGVGMVWVVVLGTRSTTSDNTRYVHESSRSPSVSGVVQTFI